jgi:hypothetical protein
MMARSGASESVEILPETEGVTECLLRLASKAHYFRSMDGRFHARVTVDGRDEIHGLKSADFCDWLIERFREERGVIPAESSLRRVLAALLAQARFDKGRPAVHVRIGREIDGEITAYYLDLANSEGQAVKISARGWSVVDRTLVHFERPAGMLPLPTPQRDGSIERLRSFVNLTEPDFRLLIGWMAAALLPEGPYPILVIHGVRGSAKTTLVKVIRALVDPQVAPVLSEPSSSRDLMVTSLSGWLLVYDNLSVLPNWLSDGLCRLATGGGFAGRALFTDDRRKVIYSQRPLVLSGIDEFVRRDDLADRCVFLHLPRITDADRRTEVAFWQSFKEEYPRILGGLLDAVAAGLRELPSVQLPELPRMADFACFGEAIGRGLGWAEGTFLLAYTENRRDASALAIEDSALATVLLQSAELGGLHDWTLPPAEMLEDLTRNVSRRVAASCRWPKTPRQLSDELRRIAPQLEARGILVKFGRTRSTRLITISRVPSSDSSSDWTKRLRRGVAGAV